MDISEIYMSPDKICPSRTFSGICGKVDFYALVHFIWPPFGSPTVIGEGGSFFFMRVIFIYYYHFMFVVYNFKWGQSYRFDMTYYFYVVSLIYSSL